MSEPVRIAQITDIHITEEPRQQCYDKVGCIDVREQFARVLKDVAKRPLDLVVLSGDIAATHGEPQAYVWVREQMEKSALPYVVMTGNHDVLETMMEQFAIPAEDIYKEFLCYRRLLKNKTLLFLDTLDYSVPPPQLEWLRKETKTQREVLLFMHHPPLYCGCPFMDENHQMNNIPEVWSVLCEIPAVKHIFCGHYHTERTIVWKGKTVYLTPSTMMQIDPNQRNFTVEHIRPGWRYIEWDGDNLYTEVFYAPALVDSGKS